MPASCRCELPRSILFGLSATVDEESWFLGRVLDEVENTKEGPVYKHFTYLSLRQEEVIGQPF